MLILLTTIAVIVFFYAEQGEQYKTFGKLKMAISHTIITVSIIVMEYSIVTGKVTGGELIKSLICSFVITFPFLLAAISTQNKRNSEMKGIDKNDDYIQRRTENT